MEADSLGEVFVASKSMRDEYLEWIMNPYNYIKEKKKKA